MWQYRCPFFGPGVASNVFGYGDRTRSKTDYNKECNFGPSFGRIGLQCWQFAYWSTGPLGLEREYRFHSGSTTSSDSRVHLIQAMVDGLTPGASSHPRCQHCARYPLGPGHWSTGSGSLVYRVQACKLVPQPGRTGSGNAGSSSASYSTRCRMMRPHRQLHHQLHHQLHRLMQLGVRVSLHRLQIH
jgi:hypothetical protein